MSLILQYMANHPILTFSFVGCFIGTLFTYLFPCFTGDYLCAGDSFALGNLGIGNFIHKNWAHFISNAIFFIPASLFCEAYYNCTAVIALIIIFSLVDCMLCIPLGIRSCGYSGVSYMLCALACMYGLHWWGFVLLGFLFISSFITDFYDPNVNKFAHVSGFITGTIAGLIVNI